MITNDTSRITPKFAAYKGLRVSQFTVILEFEGLLNVSMHMHLMALCL